MAGESENISKMAELLSKEMFNEFFWEQSGPVNINWKCVNENRPNLKKIQISYQNKNYIFKSEINSNGYIISDDRDKEFVIDIAREYLKETYTDR
jgi:hypothetical protein